MVQRRPAEVGMTIDEIDTPALVIDLSVYERNLDKMAAIIQQSGKILRPHAKMHKSPEVALDQIKRGAIGVCCQKISEAEVMVEGGVKDVLITNEIVTRSKLIRVAELALKAKVGVCVDDEATTISLNQECAKKDTQVRVLVEIDVGGGRCGVTSIEETIRLAKTIKNSSHLIFGGLQAYHGSAQHIRSPEDRKRTVEGAAAIVSKTVDALKSEGIICEVVTGGGTGTMAHDINRSEWNELQCGSYAFMDADYGKNLLNDTDYGTGFEHSMFIYATIISATTAGKAITDAGLKAIASDSGNPIILGKEHLNCRISSDEHSVITFGDDDHIKLGDRLLLIPGHCDPTVNLYDWYVGVRDGRVEKVWPVAARGALS